MGKTLTIFLDVDGVLTPIPESGESRDWLARLEFFETSIRPYLKRIEIVVSSSWRHHVDYQDFRSAMSDDVAAVVVGQTGASQDRKLDEINAWLAEHGPKNWVAIDDDESEFDSDSPLIKVDPTTGYNRGSFSQIRDRLFRLNKPFDGMTMEDIGNAAVKAAKMLERNKNALKEDAILISYLTNLNQLVKERDALNLKVLARIREVAPELADLAISAFDDKVSAAEWFCEPISAKNLSTPLEYVVRGNYESVQALLRGIKWDVYF